MLDECHKAKNMGNGKTKSDKVTEEGRDDLDAWKKSTATKSAMFVASLQQQLPLARIVYLSATGASDPKHFCNLARLGLWGPGTAFKDQFDFIDEMHKGGIGGLQMNVLFWLSCSDFVWLFVSVAHDACHIQMMKCIRKRDGARGDAHEGHGAVHGQIALVQGRVVRNRRGKSQG